jgi:hypothetical protein
MPPGDSKLKVCNSINQDTHDLQQEPEEDLMPIVSPCQLLFIFWEEEKGVEKDSLDQE